MARKRLERLPFVTMRLAKQLREETKLTMDWIVLPHPFTAQEQAIPMQYSAGNLIFPVIRFSKDGTVQVAMNSEELKTTNNLAIKNGYFDQLRLTCADGKRFVVKSVRKAGTKKPWWHPPGIFETYITVEFDLEANGTATLEELKQALIKVYKRNPGRWEERLGDEEFPEGLGKCKSYQELVGFLRPSLNKLSS